MRVHIVDVDVEGLRRVDAHGGRRLADAVAGFVLFRPAHGDGLAAVGDFKVLGQAVLFGPDVDLEAERLTVGFQGFFVVGEGEVGGEPRGVAGLWLEVWHGAVLGGCRGKTRAVGSTFAQTSERIYNGSW